MELLPQPGLDQKAYLLARGSSGASKVRTGFQWLNLVFDHVTNALQGHFVASAVAIRSELKQALFMEGHGMPGLNAIGCL